MTKWTITTSGYRVQIEARSAQQAVIAAFKERAPRAPGMLTKVSRRDGPPLFIETFVCLKAAGYTVRAAAGAGVKELETLPESTEMSTGG